MTVRHAQHAKNPDWIGNPREFYDNKIESEWGTFINNPHWDFTRYQEVKNILLAVPAPTSILDVGCGCGYHDLLLAQHSSAEKIIGVDFAEKCIEKSNKEYPHHKIARYHVDIDNYDDIIKKEGQFDLVVSFHVIEHVSDPEGFLRKCAGCAKEGGFIAIVTPNHSRLANRYLRLRGLPMQFSSPTHYAEFTLHNMIEMGEKLGLALFGHFGVNLDISFFPIFGRLGRINAIKRLISRLGGKMIAIANDIGIIYQKR